MEGQIAVIWRVGQEQFSKGCHEDVYDIYVRQISRTCLVHI